MPVARLSDADLIKSVKKILFRIAVITGWTMPEEKLIRDILYDELLKKLREDHSDLNFEEIAYAVRQFGTTIKDWGKNINLSLLDEVLIPYKSRRMELSRLEEIASQKTLALECAKVEGETNYEELLETVRSVYLKTRLAGLIPTPIYDFLERGKEIDLTTEEKAAIRLKIEKRIENEAVTGGVNAMRELRGLRENKRAYEIRVRNECKKLAVAIYFEKQHEIDNF